MWFPLKFTRRIAVPCLALALGYAARADIKAGDVFPPLRAAGAAGASLPATRGKVLLVDFWASWCAPCKASFPVYAKIYQDDGPRGLVIVAVSVDDSADDYARFVRRHAPPFLTLLDEGHRLVSQVSVPTMPTSYLIGRDGRVRFVHEGFHGAETDRRLRAEIDTLLREKS